MRKMKKVDREFIQSLGKNKISELNMQQIGRLNQKRVAEHYENQGYKVFDVNEQGFPDLIVIPDDKIFHKLLFVEVKGGKHEVHWPQSNKLFELSELGAEVKIGHVIDHLDEDKWRIVEEEPPLKESLSKIKATKNEE